MSRNRLYLLCPAVVAMIAAALLAAPGCDSSSCQGARSKICEKACACTSKCTVAGLSFDSKTACSLAFGAQCDPTKHDVDWPACSTALDTAECSGGVIPDGGKPDGGVETVLLIPDECSAMAGAGGSGSSSSATSSGSM